MRDEIVNRLWGRDVFIDIDTSVNTVIRKLRRARALECDWANLGMTYRRTTQNAQ